MADKVPRKRNTGQPKSALNRLSPAKRRFIESGRVPGEAEARRAMGGKKAMRELIGSAYSPVSPDTLREAEEMARIGTAIVREELANASRGVRDTYHVSIAEAVLLLVMAGMTVRNACHHLDVSEAQVRVWDVRNIEGFGALMREARRAQVESWADDLMMDVDDEGFVTSKHAVMLLAARRLRFDVKKWLMTKNNPRFQDKQVLEGGQRPVRVINENMTPQEAAEAYADTLRELE